MRLGNEGFILEGEGGEKRGKNILWRVDIRKKWQLKWVIATKPADCKRLQVAMGESLAFRGVSLFDLGPLCPKVLQLQ